MLNPKTDTDFPEALLDAEIHPADILSIIYMWLNGSRDEAVASLNSN